MRHPLLFCAVCGILVMTALGRLHAGDNSKDAEEIQRLQKQLQEGIRTQAVKHRDADKLACILARHDRRESGQVLRSLLLATEKGGSYLFDSDYLDKYPERTARELVALLKDSDAKVRAWATTVLGNFWVTARSTTRRSDVKYRRAVPNLAAVSKELPELLRRNLGDKDHLVRWASAEALIATELPVAAEVIPLAVSWLKEASSPLNEGFIYPSAWNPAQRIFAADPDRAAALLLASVLEADGEAQARMAMALRLLPVSALRPHLAKALRADDKRLRQFTFTVLHSIPIAVDDPLVTAVLPELTKALGDSEAFLRIEAVGVLVIRPRGVDRDRLAAVLAAGLEEKESGLRLRSIGLLRDMGKSALAALPALEKTLADEEPVVRLRAAAALVALAPDKTASILPVLKEFLAVGEPSILAEALVLIAGLEKRAAVLTPQLMIMVADARNPFRLEAARVLLAVDPTQSRPAFQVVHEVLPKMTNADEWPVMRIIRLLGPEAKPLQPELLRTFAKTAGDRLPHRRISWGITIAMVDPGAQNQAALYIHQRLIGSAPRDADDKDDILYELETIGRGAKVFLPDLQTMVKTNDPYSTGAIQVLAAIGPDAKETLPLLRSLLKSQPNLTRHVQRAIKMIESEDKRPQ